MNGWNALAYACYHGWVGWWVVVGIVRNDAMSSSWGVKKQREGWSLSRRQTIRYYEPQSCLSLIPTTGRGFLPRWQARGGGASAGGGGERPGTQGQVRRG